ncbi:hypothetical protein CSA56_06015 [candidate division KSB3 bacterium]|uniref:Uncharacterized protein n=1 Tax=candidate division KSB3 bacterium TaxID=2044937 RepID=A0A2G6KH45_9BACT|nr:MAG: hypothetical protein CSA56_06015 [candidate division KSB3 bacterium]
MWRAQGVSPGNRGPALLLEEPGMGGIGTMSSLRGWTGDRIWQPVRYRSDALRSPDCAPLGLF